MQEFGNGIGTTYSYGSYNKLSTVKSSLWNGTYTFDNSGNLKTLVNGSTTTNYNYNFNNQLTSVVKNGQTIQNNTYDASGRRLEATGMGTMYYSYLGTNTLFEKNTTGAATTVDHFYADGLQIAQTSTRSGVSYTRYYQTDLLGSTRMITSTTNVGTPVFSSYYKPYGQNYAMTTGNISANLYATFLFTGKPQDSKTGLYYYFSRFYDPVTGRFLTEDSIAGTISNPSSQNRYIYALDNPTSNTDPSGHVSSYGCGCGTGPDRPPTSYGSTCLGETLDECGWQQYEISNPVPHQTSPTCYSGGAQVSCDQSTTTTSTTTTPPSWFANFVMNHALDFASLFFDVIGLITGYEAIKGVPGGNDAIVSFLSLAVTSSAQILLLWNYINNPNANTADQIIFQLAQSAMEYILPILWGSFWSVLYLVATGAANYLLAGATGGASEAIGFTVGLVTTTMDAGALLIAFAEADSCQC